MKSDELLFSNIDSLDETAEAALLVEMLEPYWTQETAREQKLPMTTDVILAIVRIFANDINAERLSARASIALTYIPPFTSEQVDLLEQLARSSDKHADSVLFVTSYSFLMNPSKYGDSKQALAIPEKLSSETFLHSKNKHLRWGGFDYIVDGLLRAKTIDLNSTPYLTVVEFAKQNTLTADEAVLYKTLEQNVTAQQKFGPPDTARYDWFDLYELAPVENPVAPESGVFIERVVERTTPYFGGGGQAVIDFLQTANSNVQTHTYGISAIEETLWIKELNWSEDDLCILLFALRQYDEFTTDWIDPEDGLKLPSLKYPLQGVEKELITVYQSVLIDHDIDFGLDKRFHENLHFHIFRYIEHIYGLSRLHQISTDAQSWIMSKIPDKYLANYEGRASRGKGEPSWREDPHFFTWVVPWSKPQSITRQSWRNYYYYLRTNRCWRRKEWDHPLYQACKHSPNLDYMFTALENKWISRDEMLHVLASTTSLRLISGYRDGIDPDITELKRIVWTRPLSDLQAGSVEADTEVYQYFVNNYPSAEALIEDTLTAISDRVFSTGVIIEKTKLQFTNNAIQYYFGARYLAGCLYHLHGSELNLKKGKTSRETFYQKAANKIVPHPSDSQADFNKACASLELSLQVFVQVADANPSWAPFIAEFLGEAERIEFHALTQEH